MNFKQNDPMGDFGRLHRRAVAGERVRAVFLGGSLTWGAQATNPQVSSYRALISRKLEEYYPQARFHFWDAAIGGTGSQLAAFRLERDVLSQTPDLVFLDFTVNDDAWTMPDLDRLASYESLVRRLVQVGVPLVQMILPAKKDVLPNPPARPLDAKHREIGLAYGLAIADVVMLAQSKVLQGYVTPDELWDVPTDAVHPGDAGYALYAQAAWEALQQAVSRQARCRLPAQMLHTNTYLSVNRFQLAALEQLPRGWKMGKPCRSAIAYDFMPSRWMDTVVIAETAKEESPEPLALNVWGSNLLLFGEATMQSGGYGVRIDGREAKRCPVGSTSLHGNGRYVEMVAQNLDVGVPHRVEIIPELASGQELRLESLCVAGGLARVER